MNTAFILGQGGLLFAAAAGIGIIHYQATAHNRPAWYYFIAVWLISVMSVFLFSQPIVSSHQVYMPAVAYYFRFAFGIERVLVYLNYRFGKKNKQLSTGVILRVNTILAIASVLLVVGVFGWFMYGAVLQNRSETHQLRTEIRAAKIAPNDALLQRKVDTLSAQLLESKQENARLLGLLEKANAQLYNLTDILISLKKAIARLGANVERTRTSSIVIPVSPMRPQGATGPIPTNRVQPIPTGDPNRLRVRGGKVGMNAPPFDVDNVAQYGVSN